MTIFLEISKQFLGKELQALSDTLNDGLQSMLNTVQDHSPLAINKEWYGKQLVFIRELMTKISALHDAPRDEQNVDTLKQLLDEYQKIGIRYCSEHYLSPDFEIDMQRASNLLQRIFDTIAEAEYLNIPSSPDPLNIFRHHVTLFRIEHIFKDHRAAIAKKSWADPFSFVSSRELATKKEEMARDTLAHCEKTLKVLDKKHPDYHRTCHEIVSRFIEDVEFKNAALCKQYSWSVFFQRKPGLLATCMSSAKALLSSASNHAALPASAQGSDDAQLPQPAAAAKHRK